MRPLERDISQHDLLSVLYLLYPVMSTHNTTGNDILLSPVSPIESTLLGGSEGSNAGPPHSDHTQFTGPHREERDPHSELFSRASVAWRKINALNHKVGPLLADLFSDISQSGTRWFCYLKQQDLCGKE